MALILAFSTETFSFCNTLSLVEAVIVRVPGGESEAGVGVHVVEAGIELVLGDQASASASQVS